jgi:hypothetical protein
MISGLRFFFLIGAASFRTYPKTFVALVRMALERNPRVPIASHVEYDLVTIPAEHGCAISCTC